MRLTCRSCNRQKSDSLDELLDPFAGQLARVTDRIDR
jgi:hypothetical protein